MLSEQERLKLYSEASTRPWYFDGRDIFTTGSTEETGGHRLVIPLPNTLHPTQQVSEADAKFVVMAVNENEGYWRALSRIVEADDSKEAANASGQHASPISRWIPTEEAIQAARELLRDSVQ